MTTTATSTDETPPDQVELPPGYYTCPDTGAWLTLPWPGDHVLPWGHPSRLAQLPPSLGPAVIRWCETWLVNPTTGEQWRFTPAQKRWLHLWYALTPEGRWVYWSGCKRGAKGVGKDPLASAMVLVEFAGPVEFVQWGPGGRPLSRARRMALVQIGANSEAQAADLLRLANAMMSKRLRDRLGMTKADAGVKRTVRPGGSRIELLTASEASNEGDPATAVFLNETHHMTDANRRHEAGRVGDRNVSKSPSNISLLCELTNAFQQGQDSPQSATTTSGASVSARAAMRDLFMTPRSGPSTQLHDWDSLMRRGAYTTTRRGRTWSASRCPRRTRGVPRPSRSATTSTVGRCRGCGKDPKNFDAMAKPSVKLQTATGSSCSWTVPSLRTRPVWLVPDLDGIVFVLGVWQKPHGDRGSWSAPRDGVDDTVTEAFEKYSVLWFGVDPSPATDDDTEVLYWKELIDERHRRYRRKLLLQPPRRPARQRGPVRHAHERAHVSGWRTSPGSWETARMINEEGRVHP